MEKRKAASENAPQKPQDIYGVHTHDIKLPRNTHGIELPISKNHGQCIPDGDLLIRVECKEADGCWHYIKVKPCEQFSQEEQNEENRHYHSIQKCNKCESLGKRTTVLEVQIQELQNEEKLKAAITGILHNLEETKRIGSYNL